MKNQVNLKSKILLVFSVTVLFSSCQKDNLSNNSLKNKLIGTWHYPGWEAITFNSDNTFFDTYYEFQYSNGSLYEAAIDSIKGRYSIENGQVRFSDLKSIYARGESEGYLTSSMVELEPLNNVYFEGNKIALQEISVFTSLSGDIGTNSISGKWTSTSLAAFYDRNYTPQHTGGIVKATLNFKSDSSVVYQKQYLFEGKTVSDPPQNYNYQFDGSVLVIKQLSLKVTVTFYHNQMFWFHPKYFYQKRL